MAAAGACASRRSGGGHVREGVAALLEAVGQPVRVADVHVHAAAPGHAVVRMVAARLGEADRATWSGAFSGRLPLVMGAEGAGIVEEVGPGVTRVAPGDHVVVADARAFVPGRPGASAAFRPLGTFATYAVVPQSRLVRVHPAVPLRRVAEAGGATLSGYAAGKHAGDLAVCGSLLVVGLGEVGEGALAAALTGPAARVVALDRRPDRLEWARALGVEAIDAARPGFGRLVRAATGGHGADAAVLTGDAGGPTIRASNLLRPGGAVVHAMRAAFIAAPHRSGGWDAADGPAGDDPERLVDRFAHDRPAVTALSGPDGDLEDLSELLAAGDRAGAVAALIELSFDMP